MAEYPVSAQQIVQRAGEFFATHGYDDTSLHAIADDINMPLSDLQQLHGSKAQLALALYRSLGQETLAAVNQLPDGLVAARYLRLLDHKLDQLTPHVDTVAALFAQAMRPNGSISAADLSPGRRDPMLQAFSALVDGSRDVPPKADAADNLAFLLYTFHYLVIVFWLYDRTEHKEATRLFLDFLREFMNVARPMMALPLFNKALNKLAKIMMLVFGGARLVEPNER